MPRRSRKALIARQEKAQEQMLALLHMTPANIPEGVLRQVEEEIERLESMTDEELEDYYTNTPEGLSEIADQQKLEEELDEWERTSIEKRPNPLGRKLIRRGKLELYQQIYDRISKGVPRKVIADQLGITKDGVKIALRNLRLLTGQDPKSHGKNHVHKGDEYKHCPQCRGYVNQGTRDFDSTNPRRRHKKKEIPVTRINLEGEHDEKLDALEFQCKQSSNRRKYKPPSE